jgi:hypothetical protein
MHVCEVCGRDGHRHYNRPFGVTYFFLSPCCKGCSCDSWKDALESLPTDNRQRYEKYGDEGVTWQPEETL